MEIPPYPFFTKISISFAKIGPIGVQLVFEGAHCP